MSTRLEVSFKYTIGDMVMARVQVQSKAATGIVGKLFIQSRGPYKVIEDHNNGSYLVKSFDKLDATSGKFLAQDLYALPPQILPCDEVDLVDLRYLNIDFTSVAHPFKS